MAPPPPIKGTPDQPGSSLPAMLPYDLPDINKLPEESRAPEFGAFDIFFWRDAPDWYYKTFTAAGFMFSFSVLRLYLDRHELEVFLPPRAKILPESMRRSYRNREIFKSALLKTGKQTVVTAASSGIYFGGAYYIGKYRGEHTWHNFGISGATAGVCLSLALLRPPSVRATVFGALLGGGMASAGAYLAQSLNVPFWDERHDWQGWWWGRYIDSKRDRQLAEQQTQQPAKG